MPTRRSKVSLKALCDETVWPRAPKNREASGARAPRRAALPVNQLAREHMVQLHLVVMMRAAHRRRRVETHRVKAGAMQRDLKHSLVFRSHKPRDKEESTGRALLG